MLVVTTYGVYTVDIARYVYSKSLNVKSLVTFNNTHVASDVANRASMQWTQTAQAGKIAIAQAISQLK